MSQDFEKTLTAIGLLPSEAKVYLSALELGPSSVQNLAKKAGISRTATYEAVALLQNRGLVAESISGKSTLYAAEDPDKIVAYLNAEQHRFQSLMSDFGRNMEPLRLLAGGSRPIVRVYEGEAAVKAYFEHLAQVQPKSMCEFSNIDDLYSFVGAKLLQQTHKSYAWATSKIERTRVLHHGELRNPEPGIEFRKLNDKWGAFHGNVTLYQDYVTFISFVGKVVVVVIESPSSHQTLQVMFDAAWEGNQPGS